MPAERLLFVDDMQQANIDDVMANVPGAHVLLVEDAKLAMTEGHVAKVLAWATALTQ